MASHHCRTKGAKGSNVKIVAPNWRSVWASMSRKGQLTSIEAMNKQGWKTIEQAASSLSLSKERVNRLALCGKLDLLKKKILYKGSARTLNFVRPL